MMISSPMTPTKRKGLMGPPPTPITPSNQLVLRASTPSPVKSEPGDRTPIRIKAEPGLAPPSPSPSPRSSTPSRALVPGSRASASPTPSRQASVNRSLTPALLQARNRTPSQSPTPSRSYSRASSEVSVSSAGSRAFRQGTYDIDPRATKRTRRVRDESTTPTPNPLNTGKSLPVELETVIAGFVAVVDKWLPEKDGMPPSEFRKGCMDRLLLCLFEKDIATISEELANELNEDSDHKLSPSTVKELVSLLKLTCGSMMRAGLNEYSTDATPKSKSKVTKQGEWYSQYHASLPLLGGIVKAELERNVASDILYWLASRWQRDAGKLKTDLEIHVEVVTGSDCRRVMDIARGMCEIVIADIWSSKSGKK